MSRMDIYRLLFVFLHEQVRVREYLYVDLSVCDNS